MKNRYHLLLGVSSVSAVGLTYCCASITQPFSLSRLLRPLRVPITTKLAPEAAARAGVELPPP